MPIKIPEPTKRITDLIGRLDQSLKLFDDAKGRREEAQRTVTAKKFELGDLTRNAPRVTSDVKAMAKHEHSIECAQASVKKATRIFIDVDREVGKAAADVQAMHRELSAAARLELEPVQRGAMKEVETALDVLLAAIETTCAVNRILGTGSPDCYPRIPCPMTGTDLAYNRPRAEPDVAQEWLRLRKLRSSAMDASNEVPPAQAAE
jgi:hypothetical protein